MANCAAYNCEDLGTFDSTLEQCTTYRKGGVSQIVLVGYLQHDRYHLFGIRLLMNT